MTLNNISPISIRLIKTCFQSEHYPDLLAGQSTHDPALRFCAQLVPFTQDKDLILEIIKSALPEKYSGNTLDEIPKMIDDAIEKGFSARTREEGIQKPTAAGAVIEMIFQTDGLVLFHDSQKRGYMSVPDSKGGYKTYPIRSENTKRWISHKYYTATKKSLNSRALDEVLGTIEAKALFEGQMHQIHTRLAYHNDSIIINLANDDGCMVVITKDGYHITSECPVHFVCSETMKPLPIPKEPRANILRIVQDLLGLDEVTWRRWLIFQICCFNPKGPYFFLLVEGEQGSGKSLLSRVTKQIIDPGALSNTRFPENSHAIMIMASKEHLFGFDNISGIKNDISDLLCGLSTGTEYVSRRLYSDGDLVVFKERHPFIINGINGITNRPDLLERAIAIRLPSREGKGRKTEAELENAINELMPEYLGKICKVLSCVLKNIDTVIPPQTIRMIDAAIFAMAGEDEMGLEQGSVKYALESSTKETMAESALNHPLAEAMLAVLENAPFEGTVGNLFSLVQEKRNSKFDKYFPSSASHFSKTLERFRPAFKTIGINFELGPKLRPGRCIRAWLEDKNKPVDPPKTVSMQDRF